MRSGVITSVHAFANDPERGVFLLCILGVFIGGSLTLYAWRAPAHARRRRLLHRQPRERRSWSTTCSSSSPRFVVFVGTMWPLLAEMLTGRKVSVGPPFFDLAFTPFMMALPIDPAARAPCCPGSAAASTARCSRSGARWRSPLALGALVWSLQTGRSMLAPVGRDARRLAGRSARSPTSVAAPGAAAALAAQASRRARNLPRADWGKALAHAGLGVTIFGIAAITAWQIEDIRVARDRRDLPRRRATSCARRGRRERGPELLTDQDRDARCAATARRSATLLPEKRIYPVPGMPTTEAAIDRGVLRDLYVTLGDPQEGGGYAVRTYVKPFANWIWLGALIMALGGVLSA